MKRIIILVGTFFCFALEAFSQDVNIAVRYFKEEKYADAAVEFEKAVSFCKK